MCLFPLKILFKSQNNIKSNNISVTQYLPFEGTIHTYFTTNTFFSHKFTYFFSNTIISFFFKFGKVYSPSLSPQIKSRIFQSKINVRTFPNTDRQIHHYPPELIKTAKCFNFKQCSQRGFRTVNHQGIFSQSERRKSLKSDCDVWPTSLPTVGE